MSDSDKKPSPEAHQLDHSSLLNQMQRGFDKEMGFKYTKVTLDEVHAEFEIGEVHRQQYGLVHGGVYSAFIEVLCSVGAAVNAMARGQSGAVGLENNTTFLRAVREGTIRGVATPLTRGRKTQVWQADLKDKLGRVVASGRVRLLCMEKGEEPKAMIGVNVGGFTPPSEGASEKPPEEESAGGEELAP